MINYLCNCSYNKIILLLKLVAVIFFLLVTHHHIASAQKTKKEQPNIVVILADDLGYSDIGCYGGEIHTPNLDNLAKDGLQLRTFYNATRCCPSRAALLTGLYPHEAGMGRMVSYSKNQTQPGPYQGYLNNQSVTLAEVLKTAGYKTYMSGKWHVGEQIENWPLQRGFDRYFGLISGASSYFELVNEPRKRMMVNQNTPWFPPAKDFYMTAALTDTAVAYLKEHDMHQKEKPFFLYLAYTAPHWPLHALSEDIKRYEGFYDSGWEVIRQQRFKKMRALGLIKPQHELSEKSKNVPSWQSITNKHLWADRMEVYAAMVDRMDQGIGRIIETLKNQNKFDNTLIIFLSDNGASSENIDNRKLHDFKHAVGEKGSYIAYDEPWANVSNTPYTMYKSWTEEGGIITPFIAHWPKVIRNKGINSYNTVGHIVDIMATCVDISGATYPRRYNNTLIKDMRGKSLLPVFKGEDMEKRTLYWEHFGKWAILDGLWKLVGNTAENDGKLYNLASDPVELHDLSKKYPKVSKQMRIKYRKWANEIGVFEKEK